MPHGEAKKKKGKRKLNLEFGRQVDVNRRPGTGASRCFWENCFCKSPLITLASVSSSNSLYYCLFMAHLVMCFMIY